MLPANFIQQTQLQDQWCWAAVAASVSDYFRSLRGQPSAFDQASLATKAFNTNCSPAGTNSSDCDNIFDLEKPTLWTGNHRKLATHANRLPWQDVGGEIDNRRPVGIGISWDGGGKHFILVSDYQIVSGQKFAMVNDPDPYFGSGGTSVASPVLFDDVQPRYTSAGGSMGTWTDAYYLK